MQITLCLNSKNWKPQLADKKYKALATLVSRADKIKSWSQSDNIDNHFFGLKDNHSISIAALHAAAWEVSGVSPIWMHADPVHISTDQNSAFLIDRIALTDDETTSLLLDINQFLYADDCVLFAPQPSQWLLNLPKEPEITTVPITEMFGSNIAEKLPVGNAEVQWRRLFTELQMLLHNHPVNQERRTQNFATVDALWFWGEGNFPRLEHTDWTYVWSDNEYIRGLCYLSDTPNEILPVSFADITDQLLPDGNYLIVISDKLLLNELEQNWAQLLMNAIKEKKLDKLQLIIDKQLYEIDGKTLKRWWRRSRALSFIENK